MYIVERKIIMKKKIRVSLIISCIIITLLTITTVSAFAYGTCRTSILSFQRTYDTDMGCDYVNSPITLSSKSASTKISAPVKVNLYTCVAARKSNGNAIDFKEHAGLSVQARFQFYG